MNESAWIPPLNGLRYLTYSYTSSSSSGYLYMFMIKDNELYDYLWMSSKKPLMYWQNLAN